MTATKIPATFADVACEAEFYRLALHEDETECVYRWANRFVHAWMGSLIGVCQQLLLGMRRNSPKLSAHSQAIVLRCQALLEMLFENRDRAEADFRRSLALFMHTDDLFNASRVLNDLGTLCQARGDLGQAVFYYRQALDHFRSDWEGSGEEAMARNNLGLALVGLGEYANGVAELERAFDLYRQRGEPQGIARVQINLGQLYRRQGNTEQALEAFQQALKTLHDFGEQRVIVEVLNSIGVLYRYQGDFEQAIDYYTQSLELAQTVDDLGGQAQALGNLGTVYQLQSKMAEARTCYQEALALHELLGDTRGQAQMWGNFGHIHSFEEQEEQALRCYQRGLEFYRESGEMSGQGTAQINVAGAFRNLRQFEQAEPLYQEALGIGRQQQNLRLQDFALGAMGTLCMMQARWNEAEHFLQEALMLQQRRQDTHAQVETIYKQGMLSFEQGHFEQIEAIVEPAWELAQEHGYSRWLINIAWLLGDGAFRQHAPGTFNYYGVAVVFALQYQDQRRYEQGIQVLERHMIELVQVGESEKALELCQYMIDFWHDDSFHQWTRPAIEHVRKLADSIHCGSLTATSSHLSPKYGHPIIRLPD